MVVTSFNRGTLRALAFAGALAWILAARAAGQMPEEAPDTGFPPTVAVEATSGTLPALERDLATSAPTPAAWPALRARIRREVADPESPTTPTESMFYAAAVAGDGAMLRWLRRHGGDIDVVTPPLTGSALHLCVNDRATTAVRLLLEAGASPDDVDRFNGSPAVLDAANLNDAAILALLLEHKADPDAVFAGLRLSALHAAATDGVMPIARLLLGHGADPNIRDARGVTPLHLAIQLKHPEMVRLLLDKGADPNAASDAGTTPLMVAERGGMTELAKLLREHGAKEKPDPLAPAAPAP